MDLKTSGINSKMQRMDLKTFCKLILDVRELILVKIYRIISILIIWVKKEIFGSLQKFVSKRSKFVSKNTYS